MAPYSPRQTHAGVVDPCLDRWRVLVGRICPARLADLRRPGCYFDPCLRHRRSLHFRYAAVRSTGAKRRKEADSGGMVSLTPSPLEPPSYLNVTGVHVTMIHLTTTAPPAMCCQLRPVMPTSRTGQGRLTALDCLGFIGKFYPTPTHTCVT